MSAPSPDDLVLAVCPADKPHKCPPYGVCYGRYHYCSAASKSAEPCISETILMDLDNRQNLCQDIAKGKNVTEFVRHPACTLKADCFDEFETLFYSSTEVADNDTTCPWTCILAISLGIAAVITVIAVTFAIRYRRKKAKKSKLETEQQRMLYNNNDSEAGSIQTNNMKNEQRSLENGNQRQQSTDPDPNDTGSNTELMSLVRRDEDDAANAPNPPDSGGVPDPAVNDINTGAPSGSVSYRNSNHSSGNSSASIGSEPPEENQPSTSPNIIRQEDHPAEVEHRQHRAVHMPSSEPSGAAQLVTNQTGYPHTNNGTLE